MDVSNLRQGEKIAGISGIALLIIMFAFDWFGYKATGGFGLSGELGGRNAWGAFSFIDIILFLAVVSGIALAATSASGTPLSLPVALSAITAGLGILATVLVLFRIISPPDLSVGGISAGGAVDTTRKIGVFLGLIAAAGVAYGGYSAMQEEGTSFQSQADRLRDSGGGGGSGGGGTPPPPTGGGGGAPPPPSA
jgi:hypothetical protein